MFDCTIQFKKLVTINLMKTKVAVCVNIIVVLSKNIVFTSGG